MGNHLRSAIYGFAVGDGLGVPYEFKMRGQFTYEESAGPLIWSDDTAMTLATCDSIKRKKTIDPEDIMRSFEKWYFTGAYTPDNRAYGIGKTTAKAIEAFRWGKGIDQCGQKSVRDNGNGALMRILPLVFLDTLDEEIDKVSGLTHNHEISKEGCRIYVEIGKRLLKGEDLENIVKDIRTTDYYKRLPKLKELSEEEISSSGYVVDTLEASIWSIIHKDNYRDTLIKAIELGEDSDTTAAVAGGLAGILYGYQGIPKEWIDRLEGKDLLEECLWY
ncbi:MAG: ADP-ribosylglycohydrolase family protein [Gallicola sp.]|nr:ADP-ribosylglycohydrolase family protein [Gallicola sp.]